ncbi:AAA family ATPase [Paenactinomyces guangxiensis]|uniref:AAA family ATPase n=1 Tax=Paenactinomyces guangxiensis TaxID=1490290 RepID=A0A7W1WN44_9BACL|nr:AAA family ATPase [Paenactinomyces guangxiensis]MBA4492968.1 AAA family ATPase [Paenactinomyces guangxiensis]MBH8590183.1 AAA family ATPase [Paenactinomyces guangxiensis]
MKLNRVKFRGFGRWYNQTFTFREGINLIEAPNEAGKSTLLQGILALLYGAKKEGLKIKKEADWYQFFLPWQGNEYGGEIEYTLQNRDYRLIRTLHREQEREQLVDLTQGKEITADFAMDKRKDRLFLETQTGLSGESFRRITFLTSDRVQADKKEKENGDSRMMEKLKLLMSQGEDLDIAPAVKKIEAQLSEIGTARTLARPYGAALKKSREQEKEIQQLQEDYQQYIREKSQLFALKEELEGLEAKKREADERCKKNRIKAEQQQQIISLQQEIKYLILQRDSLREKMKEYQASLRKKAEWEAERKQILPPVLITYEEYYKLERKLKQKQELERHLRQIQKSLDQLSRTMEDLQYQSGEILQLDEGKAQEMLYDLKKFKRLEERNVQLMAVLKEEGDSQLTHLEQDVLKLAQLQQDENKLQQEKSACDARMIEMAASDKLSLSRAPGSQGWLIGAVAGAFITIATLFHSPALSVVPGALTAFALYRSRLWRKWRQQSGADDAREWEDTRRLAQSAAEKLQKKVSEQEQILRQWKAGSIIAMHQKLNRIKGVQLELGKNEAEMEEIRQKVKHWLSSHVKKLPLFDPSVWMNVLRDLMERSHKAKEERLSLNLDKEANLREKKSKEQQLREVHAFLQEWEKKYGTADWKQMKTWLEQSEKARDLEQKIGAEQEKLAVFEQAGGLERWEAREQELEEKIRHLSARWNEKTLNGHDISVDWKEYLSVAEAEHEQIYQVWHTKKAQFDKLQGSIEKLEEWVADLARKETEWECTKERLKEMERERTSLELAKEVLTEASREVKEQIAPRLAPYASRWIGKVTGGRYQELMLNPAAGLQMSVFVPETGENKPVEQLSRGTVDQMVFALRLSLAQFFSEHTGICLPLFLDDCFVHFDEERLRSSIRLLQQFSGAHQVLLCTCQDRERRMLEEEGIYYHSI